MSVCYKCTERMIGCHSTCEKYLAEVAENEEHRKKNAADANYNAYKIENMIRLRRRRNDRNKKH